MADLTPDIAAEVIAACQAGAEEASGALSRALDAEIQMTVGDAATFDPNSLPEGTDGPGLAIMMKFGETGAIALLPQATGLLPEWVPSPDPTGESKLSTLAQELSMLLVPETFMADEFRAAWVENLSAAAARAQVAVEAGLAPLALTAGDNSGQLTFLWPSAAPDALFGEQPPEAEAAGEAAPAPAPEPPAADATPDEPAPAQGISDLSELPNYSRSLLRVEVPISVCLASKKQTIDEIISLGPGAIITFDKSYDDLLELVVGDEPIATGEAVKVGEKFGLRVSEMIMPDERFKSMGRHAG